MVFKLGYKGLGYYPDEPTVISIAEAVSEDEAGTAVRIRISLEEALAN